jgi:hypothetical protein
LRELIRSNDAVLLSYAEMLLRQRGIGHFLADYNMSVVEGSLGILARRLLVEDDRYEEAKRLLGEAGLAGELRPAANGW